MKKLFSFIIFLFISASIFAQDNAANEPEMADKLNADGKIYVVVAVVATIFAGIIVYLINLDRRLAKLEK